jgi:uncharacterized membrane protein
MPAEAGNAPVRPSPPRDLSRRDYLNFLIRAVLITLAIMALAGGQVLYTRQFWINHAGHLHWPNWSPLASTSLVIQAHVATVLMAAAIGLFLMIGRKGTRLHRQIGYVYMAAMFATGLITLTIPRAPFGPHLGPFGPLHIFSLFALVNVPAALWAAREGRWMLHGRIMGGLFVGGIGIAGLLAFMPGRLMWQVFFG